MKSKKLSSLLGALSCAIFIAACSNSSDTPNVLGQTQRALVFASAKTALKAMDVSMDLTNGLSSNVSKNPTLALGEIGSDQTLPADKYFEINETDKIGQGIGMGLLYHGKTIGKRYTIYEQRIDSQSSQYLLTMDA